jgi:hypothetical protein
MPAAWIFGAEALRIGTFFKSLGNATLPADKDLQRVFGNFSRGPWSFETSIGQEENNLDNNDAFATTRTDQWYFSGNFSSQQGPGRGFFSWLGMPSYNLLLSQTTLKDKTTPVGATPNDSELQNLSVGGYFNYSRWNWSLAYAYSEFIDHADQQIDSETQSLSLSANIAVNPRWQLGPQWQLQQTANNDFNTVSENTLYGLASSFVLIDNRLSGNINYMINEIDAPIDPFFPVEQKTSYVTFDLTWNMRLPEPSRPGFDLSLSYSSQDINDRLITLNNNNLYQVFLNLSMTLPVAFPGGAR